MKTVLQSFVRLGSWACIPPLLSFLPFSCGRQNPVVSQPPVTRAAVVGSSSAPAIAISVQSGFPADIPGGAGNATLTQAAQFAWQEFIAVNWPAVSQTGQPGTREQPDNTKKFGDQSGPLVWHTFRSKVEIYPWSSQLPPGSVVNSTTGAITYNYDAPPAYLYQNQIPAGNSSSGTGPVAWVNLDETSEIGLNQMFAGSNPLTVPPTTSNNSVPQLIRFLAKANRVHFNYVTNLGYYNHGNDYYARLQNYQNALASNTPPGPSTPVIQFDPGTVMIKSAWRLLTPAEAASGRYHTTTVRFYERNATGGTTFYQEAQTWGMIALHIIQKTPTAPAFIFATFEQADNIRLANGAPLEDVNGTIIGTPQAGPTSPVVTHTDTPTATTTTSKGPYTQPSDASDNRLYYKELAPGLPSDNPQSPESAANGISVNSRFVPIPQAIIAVNAAAHAAINTYVAANSVSGSPWGYYKLVNVQAQPFNQASIPSPVVNPDSPFNPATFFQANIVVETDYTLGQFAGRLLAVGPSAGQTSNFTSPPVGTVANNVHLLNSAKTAYQSYNMGGCMGCHGNAQLAGNDFSFILNGGPVIQPDLPPSASGSSGVAKSLYRF